MVIAERNLTRKELQLAIKNSEIAETISREFQTDQSHLLVSYDNEHTVSMETGYGHLRGVLLILEH